MKNRSILQDDKKVIVAAASLASTIIPNSFLITVPVDGVWVLVLILTLGVPTGRRERMVDSQSEQQSVGAGTGSGKWVIASLYVALFI